MSTPPQLPLDFDYRPSLSGEDFLVSSCNAEAVAWLDRWPDWPAPFLLIYGEASCGKTHLAEVFCQATAAQKLVVCEDPYAMMGEGEAGVIEDVDQLVETQAQALFHLYNHAKENGKKVLLTARTSAQSWNVGLADLKSRLTTVPAIEIGQPDDALMEAILVKLFNDRQLQVERGVITYMLGRMERSFAAALGLVKQIDETALAEKRKITVALARSVLQSQ